MALAAIHARGVVHGDVKPSNIAGSVFLDFGSAALDGAPAMPGASVAFTAPELWRGGAVSEAADVYALGCVLYAVVVGRPPFAGEPRVVEHAHLMLRPAFAGVDSALAAILRGCLAKDPAARPSATALATALAGWTPAARVEAVAARARLATRAFAIVVADVRAPAPSIAKAIAERGGALLHVRGARAIAAWPGHDVAAAVAAARELQGRHGARAFVDVDRIASDDGGEPVPGPALVEAPPVPVRWNGVVGTARVAAALRLRALAGGLVDLTSAPLRGAAPGGAGACDLSTTEPLEDAPLVGRDRELARAIASTRPIAIRGVGRSRFARELAARLDVPLISARDTDALPAGRVVVDDGDAASDALLAALADRAWFAIVGSARVNRIVDDAIELAPLAEWAARQLFETALGVERIADDVMRRLVALAGGAPGAILDLAAHLRRCGAVRRHGDLDRYYLAADAVTLPAEAADSWLAEAAIAALPGELRALVGTAAWLEPDFELAELEAVVDAAGGEVADPAVGLVELATRGIAVTGQGMTAAVADPGPGWRLASAAIVAAARRLVVDPRPIAAAALADVERAGVADARHRRAIASYAQILGDRTRAAAQLVALADDARRAHRDADAEADYTAALADLAGADRARALLGRGVARYRLDRADDAVADLEAAAALGEPRAYLELATALDWLSRYADSARAVELAVDAPDVACALAMARGRSALRTGRSDLAVPWLEAAADAPPRVDTDDHRMVALLLLGPALVHVGDLAGAERRFDEALALADRLGDSLARCAAFGNRQLLWSARGDHARARADLVAARELARRLGHAVPERNTTYNLAEYLYWSGELDDAARLAERSRDLQRRLVGRALEDEVLIARIAAVRGDAIAARDALARADRHAEWPAMIASLARAVTAYLDREPTAFDALEADLLGEELVEVLAFRHATELATGRVVDATATASRARLRSKLQAWRFRGSGLQAGAPS